MNANETPDTEWDGTFKSALEIHGEEQMSQAFWRVTREFQLLDGGVIPESVLDGVRVAVLQSINDPQSAGRILYEALAELDWYWPRWEESSDALAEESLGVMCDYLRGLPDADLLDELSKDEVRTLAIQSGKQFPKAATGKVMRQWLLDNVASNDLNSLLAGFRSELISASLQRLRLRVASGVVRRINAIVYAAAIRTEYVERLQNSVLMHLRPNCQFHCAPLWGDEPLEHCQKWHGRVLPLQEALEKFPQLPCDSLACGCRLITCK